MANITITIQDNQLQRVLDGIANDNNYQSTIPDAEGNPIPNPETKTQFAKRMVIARIKGMVLGGERKAAQATAELTLPSETLVVT